MAPESVDLVIIDPPWGIDLIAKLSGPKNGYPLMMTLNKQPNMYSLRCFRFSIGFLKRHVISIVFFQSTKLSGGL